MEIMSLLVIVVPVFPDQSYIQVPLARFAQSIPEPLKVVPIARQCKLSKAYSGTTSLPLKTA